MKAVTLIVAILVAFGAAGIAFFMANAQTAELQEKVKLLEDNLAQTKVELARANEQLAKADTSKLQEDVNELSDALWAKVGDLGKKDAALEAEIKKLASAPPAAPAPTLAGNPDDPNADPEAQDMRKLMQGAGRMFRGFGDRMLTRQMDRYKEQLNLTEAQAEDVKNVLSKQGEKIMETISKAFEGGEDVDRRAVFEEMMKDRDEALQAILTPEQFEKFKELEQNQMGRMGGMFGGPGGRGRRGGGEGQPQPGPGGDR